MHNDLLMDLNGLVKKKKLISGYFFFRFSYFSLFLTGFKLVFKPQMNIFFVETTLATKNIPFEVLRERLRSKGVLILGSGTKTRFVTHHQVNSQQIELVLKYMQEIVAQYQSSAKL